ncbi:MAG: response regulator transcription factor [Peptococcaceae bacterium]
MMPKILVVEDENHIRENIVNFLLSQGYPVIAAPDGRKALEIFSKEKPDLILLDIMLPELNGFDTCREIRRISQIPVIMLTAKGDEVDKLIGLELGADDYITKPFSLREVEARIRAVLRRTRNSVSPVEEDDIFTIRDLQVNFTKREVSVQGTHIDLTPSEYTILVTLVKSPGRPFSRLQLLNATLGESYAGYERAIDTHISNLRKKIESDPAKPVYILTVYGFGYKIGGIT